MLQDQASGERSHDQWSSGIDSLLAQRSQEDVVNSKVFLLKEKII